MSKKANDTLREMYVGMVEKMFKDRDEDVLRTGSNEIAFPVVDSEGNDNWVTVVVKIPTGSRDGDPYDGYGMAEEYKMKLENKAIKAKEAAAAKARKIKRDEAERAAKKAKREAMKKEREEG